MEDISSNNSPEADDKDKLSVGKKKPAEKLGWFAFESKAEKADKDVDQKRLNLLSLLTGKQVNLERVNQSSESKAEEAQLTPSEEKLVEQAIILDRQEAARPTTDMEAADENIVAAVDSFHDKVLHEDLDSSQALAETLAEINQSPEMEASSLPIMSESEPATIAPMDFTAEPVALRRLTSEIPVATDDQSLSHRRAQPRAATFFGQPDLSRQSVAKPSSSRQEATPANAGLIAGITDKLLANRQADGKSEKHPASIQKKLEQQVATLQREIITKEFAIRQAVTERLRSTAPVTRSEAPGRAVALEANRLHSEMAPERIGRVLVVAEASSTPKVETATLQPIDKHIETLSRADLLELSSKTVIDGSSLRQAYETNLISEKGLRRVIIEHLRGGDVRRALRRELVEHEIDFERDPQLRDRSPKPSSGAGALNNLLQQVDASSRAEAAQELAVYKAQATHAAKQQRRSQQRRSWLDIVLISTIAVLLTLVLILVFNRQ